MTAKKLFLHQFISLRKHLNKNQDEWATLLKKKRETITRMEHGQAALRVDYLLNIAEDAGIHPADFFCFNPDTKRVEYPTDAAHLSKIAQLEKTVAHLLTRIAQLETAARAGAQRPHQLNKEERQPQNRKILNRPE